MKHLFLLSGDYIDLAKEEVISVFNIKNSKLVDKILIADLKNNKKFITKDTKRLSLTRGIYKFLFECKINDLIKTMKNYDWDTVYKDSFCLRTYYLDNNIKDPITRKSINKNSLKNIKKYQDKELAKYIWHSVTNPRVNLKNPKTKIELFFKEGKVYCGLLIYEIKENFESRKAHLRPFPHPSSLHPKLARALVNITGVKEGEVLLDPFCGTGGFLIEAGLMNIKVVGYDISKNMVKGCKENLKYFKIKNYKIINKNALGINGRFDYVVTDLPYGLNSNVYLQYNKNSLKSKSNRINLKSNARENQRFSVPRNFKKISSEKNPIKNIEKFYLQFLKILRKKLKPEKIKDFLGHENSKNFRWKKAVIIFPSFVDYESIIKRAGFGIEKEVSVYVHRSLARKITRIRPN